MIKLKNNIFLLKKNFRNIGYIKFKFQKINKYRSIGVEWSLAVGSVVERERVET